MDEGEEERRNVCKQTREFNFYLLIDPSPS